MVLRISSLIKVVSLLARTYGKKRRILGQPPRRNPEFSPVESSETEEEDIALIRERGEESVESFIPRKRAMSPSGSVYAPSGSVLHPPKLHLLRLSAADRT